jgi:flagellar hook assembly protein FlgD
VPVITALRLYPNQPNPFNPQTVLVYELPQSGAVRLEVFDLRGRLVRTLVDGALAAGRYEVLWDGRNAQGREQPSGVYLSRLRADGREVVGRMTLVR